MLTTFPALLGVLLLFVLLNPAQPLDVNFVANKDNEPLPLSTQYRSNLRKLCEKLKNAALPPSYTNAQKDELARCSRICLFKSIIFLNLTLTGYYHRQCRKLEKDDNNVSYASSESKWKGNLIATG